MCSLKDNDITVLPVSSAFEAPYMTLPICIYYSHLAGGEGAPPGISELIIFFSL